MIELEIDPFIHHQAERLRHLNVKALLFDLDDTLIATSPIYNKHMLSFSEAVALSLGLDANNILNRLNELNIEEYPRHGIDPKKWFVVLDRLGKELNSPEIVLSHYHHLDDIYFESPEVLPGVRQILQGLKSENFLTGEVTHGEMDWSIRKNVQTGLINYMDCIVAASVKGPKTKKDWQQCMDNLEVLPEECIISGDNLNGDIIPAIELGARAFSITSPWSLYRQGELPQKAITLDKIGDFWEAIDKLS